MLRAILTIIYCASFALALKKYTNFLSDEYIESINTRQSSWVAGRNFEDTPKMMSVVKKIASNVLSGSHLIDFTDTHYIDDNTTQLPDFFDAREQWPGCTTIGQVWDQGVCSAGWAISAASVLSDRVCIQLNQTINPVLSPEDLITCCSKCSFGCDGGYPNIAWEYFNETGVTSGGAYGSNTGCKPYTVTSCSHFNGSSQYTLCSDAGPACLTPCYKACDDDSKLKYEENLYHTEEPYRVYPLERQIKLEIMANGPVQATFDVWEDFMNYKSGVYAANTESSFLGEQSVKLIGWGIENDQAYWLAVNSWNSEWGDGGLFKWLINQTESAMESQVYAAVPYFPSNESDNPDNSSTPSNSDDHTGHASHYSSSYFSVLSASIVLVLSTIFQ